LGRGLEKRRMAVTPDLPRCGGSTWNPGFAARD
jgi:hypothetical protein